MSQRESEAGSALVPVAVVSSAASSGIGHVGFFFDAGDEKRPMRIKLGVAPSAAGFGGEAAGRPNSLHQPDNERNRHAELRGSRMA
jgi:hypothetical protein